MRKIRDHESIHANHSDSDDSLGNSDNDPQLFNIPHNNSVDPMPVIHITDRATQTNISNAYDPEISEPLKIKSTDFFENPAPPQNSEFSQQNGAIISTPLQNDNSQITFDSPQETRLDSLQDAFQDTIYSQNLNLPIDKPSLNTEKIDLNNSNIYPLSTIEINDKSKYVRSANITTRFCVSLLFIFDYINF